MEQDLLSQVQAFLAQHGMAPSRFGVLAVNDKNFVRDLSAGRRMWPETVERVRSFMASHTDTAKAA